MKYSELKGICKYCLGCEELIYIAGKEKCKNFIQYDKQGYIRTICEQLRIGGTNEYK